MDKKLIAEYKQVLGEMKRIPLSNDRYSGVFLPIPLEGYWESKTKILLIGRETAGWNTFNKKNTLNRIFEANEAHNIDPVVDEAVNRYRTEFQRNANGKLKTTSPSRFKQFYFRLAKELALPQEAIVHCNFFAWDYNNKSPLARPQGEVDTIVSFSKKLLATQIKLLSPQFIVFATGYAGITPLIKELFNEYFGGYNTTSSDPGKLWQFDAANAKCFRIAHPRAQHGHGVYRTKVVLLIRQLLEEREESGVGLH